MGDKNSNKPDLERMAPAGNSPDSKIPEASPPMGGYPEENDLLQTQVPEQLSFGESKVLEPKDIPRPSLPAIKIKQEFPVVKQEPQSDTPKTSHNNLPPDHDDIIQPLRDMGYSMVSVQAALKKYGNDLQKAASW